MSEQADAELSAPEGARNELWQRVADDGRRCIDEPVGEGRQTWEGAVAEAERR